jgi:hypothetical protein
MRVVSESDDPARPRGVYVQVVEVHTDFCSYVTFDRTGVGTDPYWIVAPYGYRLDQNEDGQVVLKGTSSQEVTAAKALSLARRNLEGWRLFEG